MGNRFWFELARGSSYWESTVPLYTMPGHMSCLFSTYPSKLKANLLGVFLGLHNIRKQNSIIVILFVNIFPS